MSNSKNPDRLFDIRTLNTFYSLGKIKPADMEKHLKSLPSEDDNYDIVQLKEEETEE